MWQEEFEAVYLPRHGQGQGLRASKQHSAQLPYERKVMAAACLLHVQEQYLQHFSCAVPAHLASLTKVTNGSSNEGV